MNVIYVIGVFGLSCLIGIAGDIDELIRKANYALSESREMAKKASENLLKANQLWHETHINEFSGSKSAYGDAKVFFNDASDQFNAARYSLEQLKEDKRSSHAEDAETYFSLANENYTNGISAMKHGNTKFNLGVDKHNKKISTQRKSKASKNIDDAHKLMMGLLEIQGEGIGTCHQKALARARRSHTAFVRAKNNASFGEAFKDAFTEGVRYYNQSLDYVEKMELGQNCNR